MSTSTTATPAAVSTRTPYRTANKVGLVLAGLLGANDIASPFEPLPQDPTQQNGPPSGILMLDAALGVVTVVAVVLALVTRRRGWVRLAAGARILSMITALPAFFAGGIPAWLVALVAVFTVVTIATVVLMLLPVRRPAS